MFNEFLNIDKSVTKNKAVMISFTIDTDNIRLGAKTFFRRKQDHANIGISINLFILDLDFYIYDKRHWNYDQNRWYHKDELEESIYQDLRYSESDMLSSKKKWVQRQIDYLKMILFYLPKNEIINRVNCQKKLEVLQDEYIKIIAEIQQKQFRI